MYTTLLGVVLETVKMYGAVVCKQMQAARRVEKSFSWYTWAWNAVWINKLIRSGVMASGLNLAIIPIMRNVAPSRVQPMDLSTAACAALVG